MQDNGIKAVDARGEMLAASWEPFCTKLANAGSPAELIAVLEQLVAAFQIDLSTPATVVVGFDTRPSSVPLATAVKDGLAAIGANVVDAGLVTTPQLHYLVLAHNTANTPKAYGEPTLDGYYKKLSRAYTALVEGMPSLPPLTVDCANGVGAVSLHKLMEHITPRNLAVRILRTDTTTPGALNNGSGADYVKTHQRLPVGFDDASLGIQPYDRLAAYDGDADRIVYFYCAGAPQDAASFRLLDGDKIAALAADHISELATRAGVPLQVGCVQTAYANGSSTRYLEQRVPVTCTPTGVKHLHHAAEQYDVGVYFEANGHGTVLFSPAAQLRIQSALATAAAGSAQARALAELAGLVDVINQTVGDAVSDMLLVEYVLRAKGWGVREWDAIYTELPNKLVKVQVPDRAAFATTDAERRLTAPAGLQARIDALVAGVPGARAFVRPSGTEDCVRVYAECAHAPELDALAAAAADLVQRATA